MTYKLAQLRRAVGDVQTALRYLRRAVACEPFFFAALYDLAALLRETGQTVEAAAICREVVGWQVPYPDERRTAFAELLWQCVDTDRYDPNKVTPYPLADKRGFAFLSVFEWSERAGWDVLLRASLETFRTDEEVTLILRTYQKGHGLETMPLQEVNVWDAVSDQNDKRFWDRLLEVRRKSVALRPMWWRRRHFSTKRALEVSSALVSSAGHRAIHIFPKLPIL